MGQRSQIYVRYIDDKGNVNLVANYYQWCYDERLISRARYTLEWIKNRMKKDEDDILGGLWYDWKKIANFLDVNFDMKDIVNHFDLIEDYKSEILSEKEINNIDFNEYIFYGQDNDDGKLFIDVNEQTYKLKYAFLDCSCNINNIMDGNAYRDFEAEGCIYENWRIPNEYNSQESIDTSIKNIEAISEMAELMTKEDLKDFLEYDYSSLLT